MVATDIQRLLCVKGVMLSCTQYYYTLSFAVAIFGSQMKLRVPQATVFNDM